MGSGLPLGWRNDTFCLSCDTEEQCYCLELNAVCVVVVGREI